ncbi:MAG TPA: 50S ribosomal protein L5, partial [Candidatus Paceibacterota bacterium]|nr:50S ribosomal protein L5 [Candidatus Paceibacterota bacterium]
NRLLHIALPRTKDFKGLSLKTIDEMGNVTLGLKEHSVFPETADEELKDVFGMAVTVVSTAKNKKEALAYLTHLGFPFKK